jgi:DNA-binding transcriptional LysR family regulator
MRPNPYQLTALVHVVRAGSFTGAARKLGVSQSAVTQHLQKLEAQVGSKLLFRGSDGLSLTRTGREIFDLAERHVTLERVIGDRIAGFSNLEEGHLQIIANAPVPALSLIARFTALWPDIEVDFTLFDWSTAIDKLRRNEVDIALIFDPTKSSDWITYTIGKERFVLYVPSDHHLAGRPSVRLAELGEERLLLPEYGSLTQRIVSRAIAENDLQMRRTIKTTTFPVMKEAILQGLGIGIFLDGSITKSETLVAVPIEEMPQTYESCIVVPKDKHDLRLVQSFLSLIPAQSGAGQ